jgi:hypothetical protein
LSSPSSRCACLPAASSSGLVARDGRMCDDFPSAWELDELARSSALGEAAATPSLPALTAAAWKGKRRLEKATRR